MSSLSGIHSAREEGLSSGSEALGKGFGHPNRDTRLRASVIHFYFGNETSRFLQYKKKRYNRSTQLHHESGPSLIQNLPTAQRSRPQHNAFR